VLLAPPPAAGGRDAGASAAEEEERKERREGVGAAATREFIAAGNGEVGIKNGRGQGREVARRRTAESVSGTGQKGGEWELEWE